MNRLVVQDLIHVVTWQNLSLQNHQLIRHASALYGDSIATLKGVLVLAIKVGNVHVALSYLWLSFA